MRWVRAVTPAAVTVVIALVVWEALVRSFAVPEYLLPPPSRIAVTLWTDRASLAMSAGRTALSTLCGFAIAAVAGIAVGSALSLSRTLERGMYPLTLLFQMVPLVAIAPLLAIWLGNGPRAVIASSAIVAIFPVIANTLGGLRSADPALVELFRIYGASRAARWLKLGLPGAVPSIVVGLRIAAGLSVIGAIVGEFVAGYAGARAPLGIVVITALRDFKTDRVFAAVALASLVGFAIFGLVSLASHLFLRRWSPAEPDLSAR